MSKNTNSYRLVPVGDFLREDVETVDPRNNPEEVFDLWSIPAHDNGRPEVVTGGQVGSHKKLVRPGDILLSKIVPHIQRSRVVFDSTNDNRIIASTEWIVFSSTLVNPLFVREVLTSEFFHRRFMETITGVGGSLARANPKAVSKIKIPFPPLGEQRKIAEILRTWDEAIETAEAELKAKQERKRWLAMRLISGESRLSGCSGKWQKVRLADLFERVMQKNEELCERCLTISAEKGLVDQREYFDRRISSADTSGYFLMKRGDFAYNRSYSNGYPYGVVKRLNAFDVGTVTTLYLVFTPRNRTFDPLYMEHVFDSGILNKGLRTIVQEGARAHGLLNVKAEDFFSLVVFIPDLNEQSKISKLLSDAQTQITDCESHLELLRNQKRGLMQKLLTGEVRVAA